MVGDGCAVNIGIARAIQRTILVVCIGHTCLSLQAQVGVFGTGDTFIAIAVTVQVGRPFKVGSAVGVKDDYRAIGYCVCNLIHRCSSAGIEGIAVRITDGLGNSGGFILILVGKAVVASVVRSDQENFLTAGPAALFSDRLIIGTVGNGIFRGDHIVLNLPHTGTVHTVDSLIRPPCKEVTVALQRALYIVFGRHNNLNRFVSKLLFGGTLFCWGIFHCINLCEYIVYDHIVLIRQHFGQFCRFCMVMQYGQHRAQKDEHHYKRE